MKKLLTLAACLIATALLQSQTIIRVSPTGTGDGTSWQNAGNLEEAIRSLSGAETAGTEIWVQSGTYYPTKMLVVPDSVKIYGGFSGTENNLSQRNFVANVTIVDGQHEIGSIFRLGASSELNGFTIQHGNANNNPHKNGGGVWADDDAIIANCIIQNNAAIADGGGIYAKGNLGLISSTVENNTANDGADLFGNCITQVSLPTMITHPDAAEKSVAKGGSFPALSVSATSTLPLSYQWFSNATASNENGTNLGSSNGAQTTSYTPQGTTVGTSYYYCEITNSDGMAKSNVSGLHTVTAPVVAATGCNSGTFDFGTVSFQTSTERTITGTVDGQPLTQIWSDAVTATNCQKTGFTGSSSGYMVDCRTNPNYPGDLFSWCAVAHFAYVLCPAPWRVPTMEDFVNLDKAMGGTGANAQFNTTLRDKYINSWGGAYGGNCRTSGSLSSQGSYADYWSQSEYSADNGYYLYLNSSGSIYPQNYTNLKYNGYTLRCVR